MNQLPNICMAISGKRRYKFRFVFSYIFLLCVSKEENLLSFLFVAVFTAKLLFSTSESVVSLTEFSCTISFNEREISFD